MVREKWALNKQKLEGGDFYGEDKSPGGSPLLKLGSLQSCANRGKSLMVMKDIGNWALQKKTKRFPTAYSKSNLYLNIIIDALFNLGVHLSLICIWQKYIFTFTKKQGAPTPSFIDLYQFSFYDILEVKSPHTYTSSTCVET